MPHADIFYNEIQKFQSDPVRIQIAVKCFEDSIQTEKDTISKIIENEMEMNQLINKSKSEDLPIKILAAEEVCNIIIAQERLIVNKIKQLFN
ncbi:hypothetical protein RN001_012041 [Aquatica leii]|uniref:Uncharacterized protein n=1 Tax=Aquatica leii TaxID=1421715 RepID=A0AAN7P2G4_9COLE|nr:hypothetical protein RN001_012041 [Aquatica leii]